jgi:excisionase family DNA binding protein
MNGKDGTHTTSEPDGFGQRLSEAEADEVWSELPSLDVGPNGAEPREGIANRASHGDALGEPLTIDEVAELLGCSAWTVRQRYLRQGLPHLQARPRGKLVFFREQVIAWIEKRQRHMKGGILR